MNKTIKPFPPLFLPLRLMIGHAHIILFYFALAFFFLWFSHVRGVRGLEFP